MNHTHSENHTPHISAIQSSSTQIPLSRKKIISIRYQLSLRLLSATQTRTRTVRWRPLCLELGVATTGSTLHRHSDAGHTHSRVSRDGASCTVLLGSRGYSRRRASEVPARHVQHAYMRAPRAWHFNQAFEKENPKEAMREARPSDASWPVSRQAARCEWFCGGDRRSHNQTAKVQSDAVQYVCSCMWSRAS